MSEITDFKPKTFEWNSTNISWLKGYLGKNSRVLNSVTGGVGVDIANMDLTQFDSLCRLLENTAEGRELRNKMFKAWRSKKSRDSNNGKKAYTFNLDIKTGSQLKKLAYNRPINKTLEDLINGTFQSVDELRKQTKKKKQQEKEEKLSQEYEVKALAKQEKSELIRTILRLNKQIKTQEEAALKTQKSLISLQSQYDHLKNKIN